MNDSNKNEESLVFSYLQLRKTIGILGIFLPIILFFGALIIFNTGLQSSISQYYHTYMGDVLVGTLCAFGVFLYSYKGYSGDAIYAKLASILAIGIALFPTIDDGSKTYIAPFIGILHVVFTIAFFSMLIYFSYFLFTKSDKKVLPKKKLQRNRVYKTCGILMAICILGIIIYSLFPSVKDFLGDNLVFWLESVAIWSFGVSWFTKGEAIVMLNDKE